MDHTSFPRAKPRRRPRRLPDRRVGAAPRVHCGGTKSKAESIATALNSLLNQLVSVADLEVAVAGYRGDPNGGADVGCRWGGPLAGRRFVPTTALADAPLVVENRVRSLGVPDPGTGCPGQAGRDRARFPSGMCRSSAAAFFPCWAMPIAGTWSSREQRRRRSGANRPWSSVSWATWCRSRWRWPWSGSWGFPRRADRRWSSTCISAEPRPDVRCSIRPATSISRRARPRLVPLVERAAGLHDRRPPQRPGAGEHGGPRHDL